MAGPLLSPVARSVPFDSTSNGFTSVNVQAAIEEVSASSHYSYRRIYAGLTKSIPYEQQMLSYQEIEIEDTGELEILGEVVITV